MAWVNTVIMYFSYLQLGSPKRPSDYPCLRGPLSDLQRRMVKNMFSDVYEFCQVDLGPEPLPPGGQPGPHHDPGLGLKGPTLILIPTSTLTLIGVEGHNAASGRQGVLLSCRHARIRHRRADESEAQHQGGGGGTGPYAKLCFLGLGVFF